MKLNLAGTVCESIVDGPGIRYSVFVQGCPHNCEGCQNPHTHVFGIGKDREIDDLLGECVNNPLHTGVTFSGGEPFCQAEPLYILGKKLKEHGYSIMCYTGWTFEQLLEKSTREEAVRKLLSVIDVLVDGRFDISQRSLELKFRGSANQRIIDVPASLEANTVITKEL